MGISLAIRCRGRPFSRPPEELVSAADESIEAGRISGERQCRRARPRRYRGNVVTLDDVARMAAELPEVTEGERHGNRTWFVAGKAFAWDRPFSKADIRRFGDQAPPDGPILAVRVGDLGEKEAVLAANPDAFFTIPHFDGYSAVLIQLPKVSARALRDAITDGWLACAPPALVRRFER